MDLGFETIGNATLICHDTRPVLVTDPWLVGGAYFGSWALSHEIPPQQLEAARACEYVWVSHAHPDHLSRESLALLEHKKLLVPNHFGSRMENDLRAQGFHVTVLVDRVWTQLSPRIRVMCIPDVNQDAVLLVDLAGTLVVNLNDASDRGWGRFVRNIIRGYSRSFLLARSGDGEADMMSVFTEDGQRLPPLAAQRMPLGQTMARQAELFGVRYVVPFSSMHRYQRADSAWADAYTPRLEDYPRGFESRTVELLPAFIRYDVRKDQVEEIHPREHTLQPKDPREFGDDWSVPLEKEEAVALERYFRSISRLERNLDFLRFKVGGGEHVVRFTSGRHKKGITFEVPRTSLMAAVQHEVFDELLLGNFMKTTLHGDFGQGGLSPDFTPWVARYADHGRARDEAQLRNYFADYRKRDPLGFLRHEFESAVVRPTQEVGVRALRRVLAPGSAPYKAARELYWGLRRVL